MHTAASLFSLSAFNNKFPWEVKTQCLVTPLNLSKDPNQPYQCTFLEQLNRSVHAYNLLVVFQVLRDIVLNLPLPPVLSLII